MSLTTADSLDKFVVRASQSRAITSGVKSLHVNFKGGLAALGTLRKCLSLLRHLEDLELHLNGLSHSSWVHILRSTNLEKLQNLSTNAPHSALCHFLPKTMNLQHLRLLSCCPDLCELENVPFLRLTDITAASVCVVPLAKHMRVERLSVIDLGQDDCAAFPRMLRSLASSALTLTTLHIDFDPADRDILRRISEIAPKLTALKLIERALPRVRVLVYFGVA